MPNESNEETQRSISQEIKTLQSKCVDECHVIKNNAPIEMQNILNSDELTEKTLCYVEGLRMNIQSSSTTINTNSNLLTCQFLNELKDRTDQIAELTAFTRGTIHDVEAEISRLQTQINLAQEAKTRKVTQHQEVTREHLDRAKNEFKSMKADLTELIKALFPKNYEDITEVLKELMAEKMTETSNGYIPISTENYTVITLLKDLNIVTTNPYNDMEVKLAF